MISAIVATILAQTPPLTIADQDLSLSIAAVGEFGTPLGVIKDPLVSGDFSISKQKYPDTKSDYYRLELKLKREQSKLISAFTDGLPEEKDKKEIASYTYRDKDFAYFIGSYHIFHEDYRIVPATVDADASYMSSQVLSPFSMMLPIIGRSLNSPVLRKEFPLMEDGPRKYSIRFLPNLNANTESVPGDVAFKFDIRLKDESGEYPGFFTGAIRLNTKTQKVQYLNAASDPEHQPKPPADAEMGDNKSYQFRFIAKKPKT